MEWRDRRSKGWWWEQQPIMHAYLAQRLNVYKKYMGPVQGPNFVYNSIASKLFELSNFSIMVTRIVSLILIVTYFMFK